MDNSEICVLTIIYRYIFGDHHFTGKILLLSLVSEMINHSVIMLRRLQASKTLVCVYKCFWASPQKFQTLVLVTSKVYMMF